MRQWNVLIAVKDDGISDEGPGHHLSETEVEALFETMSLPAGVVLSVIKIQAQGE